MDHVILGAGPAGVIAAETLRKADPAGSVTVIGDEPEPPYSRMAIPYLLIEDIGEDGQVLGRRLAEKADIVIDNFSVGVLDRWGLQGQGQRARQDAARVLPGARLDARGRAQQRDPRPARAPRLRRE